MIDPNQQKPFVGKIFPKFPLFGKQAEDLFNSQYAISASNPPLPERVVAGLLFLATAFEARNLVTAQSSAVDYYNIISTSVTCIPSRRMLKFVWRRHGNDPGKPGTKLTRGAEILLCSFATSQSQIIMTELKRQMFTDEQKSSLMHSFLFHIL